MRRLVVVIAVVFFAAHGGVSAETANVSKDALNEYYRALRANDEAAMLRAATRLAQSERSSLWHKTVADFYWYGRGVAPGAAEAVVWYRRAAVRGDENAMLALARAHHRGRGAERDPDAAYFWLTEAASRAQGRANLELSLYYHHGILNARNEQYADRLITYGISRIYARTRFRAEQDANAMPALQAAYVFAFRIFSCPWAADADYGQSRRFLLLAAEERWRDAGRHLLRFGIAHPALWPLCGDD